MRGWICLLAVCLLAACADSDDKERWVMKEGPVEVDVEADSVYGAKDIRVNGWEKAGSARGRRRSG